MEQTLPATARITTNRLTFATFPILGYSLTSDTVPQTQLWEIATYDLKPPLNRVAGVSTVTVQGGQVPEFHVVPNLALLQTAGVTIPDLVNAIQASNIVDSPGLYEANHQLILGLVGAQVHDADGLRQLVVKTTAAGAPVRVADVATVEQATHARLHHGHRQRQERGAAQHRAPALQQHRGRGRCGRRGGDANCAASCRRASSSSSSTISRNWCATASPACATPSSSGSSWPASFSSSSCATGPLR